MVWLAVIVVPWLGCRQAPSGVPPSQPGEVTLQLADEKDLAATVEKHHGRVVLVDFWATWCGPCTELLPHTVQLQREYENQGLAVITVSLDDTEDQDKVLKFLKDNYATTENFQSRFGGSDETVNRFRIPEAIPHLRLYDRSGKLQQTFPEKVQERLQPFGPEDVERAVKELLDGRGPR